MRPPVLILWFCLFTPVWGQQNLFNVPTGDLTIEGRLFFQEQLNVFPGNIQSSSILSLGLSDQFEFGIDMLNLNIRNGDPWKIVSDSGDCGGVVSPQLMVTSLFSRPVNNWWKASMGIQMGTGVVTPIAARFLTFFYTVHTFQLMGKARLIVGGYFASPGLTGLNSNVVDLLLGLQIPFWDNRFEFVADYVGGSNAIGVSVLGLSANVSPLFSISAGIQLPNSDQFNQLGGVLNLTFL
jgi:hypothetical protein